MGLCAGVLHIPLQRWSALHGLGLLQRGTLQNSAQDPQLIQ